jgi:DNA-binding CsgD family transcriptional regulator
VEVVYLDARPGRDEGPFLREERELLDAVAHQTAMAISHAEYQLAIRHQGHVLRQAVDRADQQTQLNHQVADNVHRVLMPIVRDLEHSLSHAQRQKVDMLRRSLGELNSPLVRHLSQRFPALTPSELRICEAIRQGLSSKEISRVEGIAVGTANRYREKIRRKLKLTGKPVNLAAFLRNACRKS